MATPGAKPLGVTAPLSLTLPTEAENQASNALIEELKRQNNYESTADTNKRYVYGIHLTRLRSGEVFYARNRFGLSAPVY